MAAAVGTFKDNARAMRDLREERQRADAAATAERRREMDAVADRFEASMAGVVQTVSDSAAELTANARSLNAVADQTQ
ncbi:hypothetical protein ABTM02_20535, partial [Acinetobacter baumannii]